MDSLLKNKTEKELLEIIAEKSMKTANDINVVKWVLIWPLVAAAVILGLMFVFGVLGSMI